MKTNTWLIAIPISCIGCIGITPYDQAIRLDTRVYYHIQVGVKRFLYGEFTNPSMIAHREREEITPGVWDFLSLMIPDLWDQSIDNCRSHSFKLTMRTDGPVVGVHLPLIYRLPGFLILVSATMLVSNRLSSADNCGRCQSLWHLPQSHVYHVPRNDTWPSRRPPVSIASSLSEKTDAQWTTPLHRSHGACHHIDLGCSVVSPQSGDGGPADFAPLIHAPRRPA